MIVRGAVGVASAETFGTAKAVRWVGPAGIASGEGRARLAATAAISSPLLEDVNLSGARRYVRLNFTPELSAGATDTAALSGVAVFGGAIRLPA